MDIRYSVLHVPDKRCSELMVGTFVGLAIRLVEKTVCKLLNTAMDAAICQKTNEFRERERTTLYR